MVELPPANRIEIAKQIDDFGMPGPPQIAGQRPALVVQRLGRKLARDERDWVPERWPGQWSSCENPSSPVRIEACTACWHPACMAPCQRSRCAAHYGLLSACASAVKQQVGKQLPQNREFCQLRDAINPLTGEAVNDGRSFSPISVPCRFCAELSRTLNGQKIKRRQQGVELKAVIERRQHAQHKMPSVRRRSTAAAAERSPARPRFPKPA